MHRVRRSKGPEILLELLEGPKHVRELQSKVGGSALTVEMRIRELLEGGYLMEEKSRDWPFRKTLRLTPDGRKLAMVLKLETSILAPPSKVDPRVAREKGRWILALLHAMGGVVESATRLQKLFFLLKREFGISEIPYDFLPFLRGPFSDGINDDVLDLEIGGFLSVGREVVEPTHYALTPKGERVAKGVFENMPDEYKKTLTKLKKFNEMGLPELLDYVYARYPEESKI